MWVTCIGQPGAVDTQVPLLLSWSSLEGIVVVPPQQLFMDLNSCCSDRPAIEGERVGMKVQF